MTDLVPLAVPRARAPEPLLDVRTCGSAAPGQAVPARETGTIVSSVSLSLRAGETIGIVGESGSGKSMTAKAVTGCCRRASPRAARSATAAGTCSRSKSGSGGRSAAGRSA